MNVIGRMPPAAATPAADFAAPARPPLGSWRPALLALALGLIALGLLFRDEAAAAVRVWNGSTAYNHCWLIAPIAAWLFWVRRERLKHLAPVPNPLFALLAVPGVLAWFAAERLGIMEGRQLAGFGLVQVLVLAVLGWPFFRAFAGPLLYLVFLVPFGGFAVGPLQHITARLIDWGLDLTGISHFVDGLLIETPAGTFHVAEACAGLRFIIAALAFGALYALVIFRSPWRRLIVMALALLVPILANGIRAGGIIVAAEYIGSAEAAVADHIVYGWGFFSAVILLLILAGLPFREDSSPLQVLPPRPVSRLGPRPARLAAAAVLAVAVAAAGPVAAMGLSGGAGAPVETSLRLVPLEDCRPAADGTGLVCNGYAVSARIYAFSPRVTWSEVSAQRWRLIGSDQDLTFNLPMTGGGTWQARQGKPEQGSMAMATWLDGRPTGGGLAPRLAQARNSVLGGGGAPVLMVVQVRPEPGTVPSGRDRPLLAGMLATQGNALAAAARDLSRR